MLSEVGSEVRSRPVRHGQEKKRQSGRGRMEGVGGEEWRDRQGERIERKGRRYRLCSSCKNSCGRLWGEVQRRNCVSHDDALVGGTGMHSWTWVNFSDPTRPNQSHGWTRPMYNSASMSWRSAGDLLARRYQRLEHIRK